MARALIRSSAALALVATLGLSPIAAGTAGAAVPERGPGAALEPGRSPDIARGLPPGPNRGLQRRCLAAAKQRADLVREMQKAVDRSVNVTDEHEAALDAILESSRTGLRDAAQAILAATTRDEIVAACKNMADGLRIVSLVYPQVRITLSGDRTTARATNLRGLLDEAPGLLEQLDGLGIDVSEWETMLAEVLSQLDEIEAAVNGVVDDVLALTPAGFGDDAKATMDDAVDQILGSRADLGEIAQSIEAALDLIDELLGDLPA